MKTETQPQTAELQPTPEAIEQVKKDCRDKEHIFHVMFSEAMRSYGDLLESMRTLQSLLNKQQDENL